MNQRKAEKISDKSLFKLISKNNKIIEKDSKDNILLNSNLKNQNNNLRSNRQNFNFVYNQSAITLIALIITIIVMLILAGVSLNATIGDNGIITRAQNATYSQSMAVLEEYLQELYVENYEAIEEGNYTNKVEGLLGLYSDYFYIPANDTSIGGSMRYVVDSEGHALYLIKKSNLPSEISSQMSGGNAGEGTYNDYVNLVDVYGVTSELKVYYCSNGLSSITGVATTDLDEDDPERTITLSSQLLALLNMDEGETLTAQSIRAITSLTITSDDGITSLSELYNFTCLKELILKNVKWTSLSGIENASILSKVYFQGCTISDYSSLSGVKNLTTLFIYNISDEEFSNLCNGIASVDFSKLESLAVVGGNTSYINNVTSISYLESTSSEKSTNTITTLEPLSKLSSTTKKAVQYLSINNNNISGDLSYLSDYTSLIYLRCDYNSITSLSGIDNATELVYLQGSYNSLGNGSTTEDTSISALSGKTALKYVYLTYNSNLAYVAYLNGLNLSRLYLAGCSTSMIASTISTVLAKTNGYYSLPVRWLQGTRYSISEELSYLGVSSVAYVTASQLETDLYENSTITYLNLEGVQISNDELNTILASMTQLTYVTLKGCTNLTSIDFVGGKEITIHDSERK